MVWQLHKLPPVFYKAAGGKAGILAQLTQAGYPVPPGFVITPATWTNGSLDDAARQRILTAVARLNGGVPSGPLAVRSSANVEDATAASYAGAFDTLLNVQGEEALFDAIESVARSGAGQRVQAYKEVQQPEAEMQVAVLVQKMVQPDYAGVLFTADPLTGSHSQMSGNFVDGLGEQLVSGTSDAHSFVISRPAGAYEGPEVLRPFARKLFHLGLQLEAELHGRPQDIEWAIAGDQLHVLQSRPVTTMLAYDHRTGEWNDSHRGDYLWSNANLGEAIPGVMTPLTWSLVQIYGQETFGNPLPGDNPFMGNIGGRFYVNLSLFASMMGTLGFSRERMNRESEEFFGNLPDDIEIPLIPFSRWAVLRKFAPFALRAALRRQRNLRNLATFTKELPKRVAGLHRTLEKTETPAQLAQLWDQQIEPLLRQAYQMLQAGTSRYENAYRPLHRRLVEQVGEEEGNLLLSGVSAGGDQLASLGPMLGLQEVANGALTPADYMARFGHRGEHEFELSWPRPLEQPGWLEDRLANLAENDPTTRLGAREAQRAGAWARYRRRFPKEAAKMQRRLSEAAAAARGREAIRSEISRLFYLERCFALRAGELTGLGDGIFYLWLEELLALLRGQFSADSEAAGLILLRRRAHERLTALPPYPALIKGRFDPHRWAADPFRRSDLFDAAADSRPPADPDGTIRGLPGSAGIVEGPVRVLTSLEDGHLLQAGEVLVATTTNVGWTPLFPRAAAIVTDVGAPLSHAAIVARELGIPAIVGAGDATMHLRTGDYVRVNGGAGTVTRAPRDSDIGT